MLYSQHFERLKPKLKQNRICKEVELEPVGLLKTDKTGGCIKILKVVCLYGTVFDKLLIGREEEMAANHGLKFLVKGSYRINKKNKI